MKVLNALFQLTSTAIFTHARGIFTLSITAVAVNVCLRSIEWLLRYHALAHHHMQRLRSVHSW